MSTEPTAKSGSKLPWIIVIVLLLALAGGGGWFWYSSRQAPPPADDAASAEAPAGTRNPAMYFPLDPAFVVNLSDVDSVRYLQADVQLMTRDMPTSEAIELHAPAIRNRLLLLFGQYSADQLTQRSAKERLQEKAREEVQALLKAEGAPSAVEAVYFTSFVTQ
ncbi:flagellar basal body-associated FliL family protein [Novilysobacter spongiicola]|uniref:Flagellar protein FliL n=1 Tax=Lysobacter spongiicola DSM 21749 TaxID=1122188 RepID=A0A1T4S1C7_9GAMM|nr:flagellar basal body-associated FliL family protein [Lysobacter spongiicola]SKA21738.1 flagellar FliL protein [Lysobacter spongiicola DSM 21749]